MTSSSSMDSPLVSVLITTYNRERDVGVAIRSALAQTYSNLEVVVVDDGSTDGTAEVVRAIQETDPRVRYFYQSNAGMGAARNATFRHARGELLAILDSDDAWLPRKLEFQVQGFSKSPKIGMVFTDCDVISQGKICQKAAIRDIYWNWKKFGSPLDLFQHTVNIGEAPFYWGNVFSAFLLGNLALPSSVCFRRGVLDELGMLTEAGTGLSEDFEFCLRISRAFEVGFVDLALVEYTVGNPDQISGGIGPQLRISQEYLQVFESYLKNYRSQIKYSDRELEMHRAKTLGWVGSSLIKNGFKTQGRLKILKAIGLYPLEKSFYKDLIKSWA